MITVSTYIDVLSMGLGLNDPWVESHMWPQQTWGQRSCRGQWPLVQVFGKKDQCIHILWCIFKSNIPMIAKVCARESRRDSWFENRLVWVIFMRVTMIIKVPCKSTATLPGGLCKFTCCIFWPQWPLLGAERWLICF